MISTDELVVELAGLEGLSLLLQQFFALPDEERILAALRIRTLRSEETTEQLHSFVTLLAGEIERALDRSAP